MAHEWWWSHGILATFVASCLATGIGGCHANSVGPRSMDGGGLAIVDGATTKLDGADTRGAVDAATNTKDAAISEITAQYRACVAYVRAVCNRRDVCKGFAPRLDPCPDLSDLCPDMQFATGSQRSVATLLACAQAWDTFSCDEVLANNNPDCGLNAGALPNDSPCVSNAQCAGGYCVVPAGDPLHPRCGACSTLPDSPKPTACGTGAPCNIGEACLEGQCVRYTRDRKLGESCTVGVTCAAPNSCIRSNDRNTCQPIPKLGDACSTILSCADSMCTTNNVCEAWPTEGMSCKPDAILRRFRCADAFTCDEGAAGGPICVPRGSAGATCKTTGSLEQSSCAAGLVCACSDGTGTCGAGTCVRRKQEGDTCATPTDLCVGGTKCNEGRCSAVSQGWMASACGI